MVLSEKMVQKHLNALSMKYPGKSLTTGIFVTLLIFSVGMITLPLSSYYLFSYLSHGSSIIAATAAIVTVHIILAAFVYKAIKEPVAELELKED